VSVPGQGPRANAIDHRLTAPPTPTPADRTGTATSTNQETSAMSNDQAEQKGQRRIARGSLGLAIEEPSAAKRAAATARGMRAGDELDLDDDEELVDADDLDDDDDDDGDRDDEGDDGDDGDDAVGASDDVPAVSRKVRRRRRRTRPRSKTIAMKRLTREELRLGALMFPPVEDAVRPRARHECREEARPCPWVSCKHHLYLDVNPETGSIKINFPDIEPWDMVETCSLDIAERGGITLEEVGEIMNLTRERIRQVEVRGLLKLRMASPSPDEVGAALLRRPGQ
jgi:hypothetical protein